jgi:hypothetical protein
MISKARVQFTPPTVKLAAFHSPAPDSVTDSAIFWDRQIHKLIGRRIDRRVPRSAPKALVSTHADEQNTHYRTGTLDERKHSSRPAQQLEGTVTILHISRLHDDAQQEAQRVDQDVPLATCDFLARVVARRIEPSPPFWAPLAVCESMIAAVGLASRPSCSRTAT